MRISIVSEGTRDYGGDGGHKGVVCVLVERILGSPAEVTFGGLPLPTLHGRGGIEKKVTLAVTAADARGDDGIAVVIDNDGAQPSDRRNALRQGVEKARSALSTAEGLAIQENEAWLIADEQAVRIGLGLEPVVSTQPGPEDVPDPKALLNAIAQRRVVGLDLEHIAWELDLEKVKDRCPRGFGRFEREVLHKLGPLVHRPAGDDDK